MFQGISWSSVVMVGIKNSKNQYGINEKFNNSIIFSIGICDYVHLMAIKLNQGGIVKL